MRLSHRLMFAALAFVFSVAVAALAGMTEPRAEAQLPAVSKTCGGYTSTPCPSASVSRPPFTRTPPASVPVTTVSVSCLPGFSCAAVVCPPGSDSCLPVTGTSSVLLYGLGLGMVTIGVVAMVFALRRSP